MANESDREIEPAYVWYLVPGSGDPVPARTRVTQSSVDWSLFFITKSFMCTGHVSWLYAVTARHRTLHNQHTVGTAELNLLTHWPSVAGWVKENGRSDARRSFPYKEPFITPVKKKPGLDSTDVSSYQLISKLSVISKFLERIVAKQQLTDYLQSADLLPRLQSGFRPGHSNLQVLSDIKTAFDGGPSTSGPVGHIRYLRPQHSVSSPADVICLHLVLY